MIRQLFLFVLCSLGPQDIHALITSTSQYLDHLQHKSNNNSTNSRNNIDIIFCLAFHLIILLPLRVIVAVSLYYTSALFVKGDPIHHTSTPLPTQAIVSPPQKTDNMGIEPTVASIIDKQEPAVVHAHALPVQSHCHHPSSAIPALEAAKTIAFSPPPAPAAAIATAAKILSTSSFVEELPVLPEEGEEEEEEKWPTAVRLPQLSEISMVGVVKKEKPTVDTAVSQAEENRPLVENSPVSADKVSNPSQQLVQPSAEKPKPPVEIATITAATVADGSDDETSSHREEEALSVESKATSHTSATFSTHLTSEKHVPPLPPVPASIPMPMPTPTTGQPIRKDRSFSIRISRSTSNMRNKISAARQKPEEEDQVPEKRKQKQNKSLRLFPLPSLSKRRPTVKEKQQQEEPSTKTQPQPSKARKRLSALFH
ncbi:hypothetical protein BX666DRAFT_2025901 [Dichotomocladium elegans]|nr:hypothetical protein BX666DRAFT_2025901 [Dichotomocladium elegans]